MEQILDFDISGQPHRQQVVPASIAGWNMVHVD